MRYIVRKTIIITTVICVLLLTAACSQQSKVDLEEQTFSYDDIQVQVPDNGFYMTAGIVGDWHEDKDIENRYEPAPAVSITYIVENNTGEDVKPGKITGLPWPSQGGEALTIINYGYDITTSYDTFYTTVPADSTMEYTQTYLLKDTETPVSVEFLNEENHKVIFAEHKITDEERTFMENACILYKPFAEDIYKEKAMKGSN